MVLNHDIIPIVKHLRQWNNFKTENRLCQHRDGRRQVGGQTRAMVDTQCKEEEEEWQLDNQLVQGFIVEPGHMVPDTDHLNADMNPAVELTRINGNQWAMSNENIKDYIRRHSETRLDWYVPDLRNTCIRDLIKARSPSKTKEGRILFNCP